MENDEDISGRYPIIKHPGHVVDRPMFEESTERNASSDSGRLSPDAIRMIAGGGPAAIRPKVSGVLNLQKKI